jgi:hypothetical protein
VSLQWKNELQEYFDTAAKLGFPLFLGNERASTPFNATPYVSAFQKFLKLADAWPGRAHLARSLNECLIHARQSCLYVEAILIGGSFTDFSIASPADVDSAWLVRGRDGGPTDATALHHMQQDFKRRAIDARLIPLEHGALVLAKALCYFTTLYSKKREDTCATRGLLLLDCSE